MECELCDNPLVAIYIAPPEEEMVGFCNTAGCPAMMNSRTGHEAPIPRTWGTHYMINIGDE